MTGIPARRTFSRPFAILASRLPVFGRIAHFRCGIQLWLGPAGVFVDTISPPASPGRGLSAPGALVRDLRPDIRVAAIAGGAVGNWTFLEGIDPDSRALDSYEPSHDSHVYW